ncbi:kinesin-like protein KIF23 [Gordionus sp. m RMFG-2023]|uniref:kinesin-like protein KIF23 n=1 Tax=Gordionus sp. m RMFG-2023 TaxID=3053472 RepID=UPI0031FD6D43
MKSAIKNIKSIRKGFNNKNLDNKDPVEVYCRIKPPSTDDICCQYIDEKKILLYPPENIQNIRNVNIKESEYTFTKVFPPEAKQKTVFRSVAKPLVQDLLNGKNGLVFAYGVTGSGKTYTMNGKSNDEGILVRCLETAFDNLKDLQTERFVFKPDKNNGYDILSPSEVLYERNKALQYSSSNYNSLPKLPLATPRRAIREEFFTCLSPNTTMLQEVCEDNAYAIFVSFVEIYNNYIYDLLEDISLDQINMKTQISKTLREDSNHSIYVSGCTEVEVKSTEEALEVLYKGIKKKRMACTHLNTESSRSHSVFNIRLVQAPLDPTGEYAIEDKSKICMSQLALVDLAGSERTNRTNNVGDRLREAGNINSSLMVLRNCLEILRENQNLLMKESSKETPNGQTYRMVPYRDSKLTHLFKNYFEGRGKVRMVVCLNPDGKDFEENMQVARFAELTQEVQVSRALPISIDTGLTPGRGKLAKTRLKWDNYDILNEYMEEGEKEPEMEDDCEYKIATPATTPPPEFDLGPNLPSLELIGRDLNMINALRNTLIQKKESVSAFHRLTLANFSNLQGGMGEKELNKLKKGFEEAKAVILELDQQNISLQSRVQDLQKLNTGLSRKLTCLDKSHKNFETILDENELARKKMEKDMERQMKAKEIEMENLLWAKNEKLRHLKQIVQDDDKMWQVKKEVVEGGDYEAQSDVEDDQHGPRVKRSAACENVLQVNAPPTCGIRVEESQKTTITNNLALPYIPPKKTALNNHPLKSLNHYLTVPNHPYSSANPKSSNIRSVMMSAQSTSKQPGGINRLAGHVASVARMYDAKVANLVKGGVPVANFRHRRRSKSVNDLKYLEHRPKYQSKTNDVLRPRVKNTTTAHILQKKELKKCDKYFLNKQEQDSQTGDLRTQIYKGDVIATPSGGNSIIFDDIEVHTHEKVESDTSNSKKRLYPDLDAHCHREDTLQKLLSDPDGESHMIDWEEDNEGGEKPNKTRNSNPSILVNKNDSKSKSNS